MASTVTVPHAGNRLRGPFNSWFLDLLEGYIERRQSAVRAELFGSARGIVADVGAGNGPTFRHLPTGSMVHAIEPNPHFHDRLRRAAEQHGLDLHLHTIPGEAIDLPDSSVDTVLTSWVLCTVPDPARVVDEIRRILRPGGQYLFLEHVAAPPRSGVGRVQRVVRRPWCWTFEGCDVARDTATTIREAGFTSVQVDATPMPTAFVPIRPQVAGVAVR